MFYWHFENCTLAVAHCKPYCTYGMDLANCHVINVLNTRDNCATWLRLTCLAFLWLVGHSVHSRAPALPHHPLCSFISAFSVKY